MTTPHRPSKSLLVAVAAAAALALSVGACSAGSDDPAQVQSAPGSASKDAATATTGRPSTSDGGSETTDTTGGSKPEESKKEVIASTNGTQPADPNDDTPVPLRLDITSAKRIQGDAVEVRLSIANLSDTTALEVYGNFARLNSADYTLSAAALVDLPNDKRYLALLDSDDICLCTDLNNRSIEPGASMSMYVQFPAPAADVDKVGFTLPGFDPVNDLEIS